MTIPISALLDAAGRQAVPVVRGIRDDQLTAPTPCAEFTVRDLLNHVFHVVVGFQVRARKEDFDFTTTPDYLTGDWRARFATETAQLVEAWAAPGAEEGSSGPMNMPARSVGNMVLIDLIVHGWDLARATGQEFRPDAEAVAELAPQVEQMAPMARQYKVFGEAVAVPAGASQFERMLGVCGRDPQWTAEKS